MAKLVDLRLNETMYWLTVVATIFLPLTFVTGFFGMNFLWMIGPDRHSARLLRPRDRGADPARRADQAGGPPARHPGRAGS